MKKYTLILASVALFSFVSSVTATDYAPDVLLEADGYNYDASGHLGTPVNCAFQFASFDGSLSCIDGKPSGWNIPKSDYWYKEASYVVVGDSAGI